MDWTPERLQPPVTVDDEEQPFGNSHSSYNSSTTPQTRRREPQGHRTEEDRSTSESRNLGETKDEVV